MAKRKKQPKSSSKADKSDRQESRQPRRAAGLESAMVAIHPPVKNPSLLTLSIVLFALSFLFLLVTALLG